MRATHWLIGCALCIAGIGSAAATSLDTSQELDSSSHSALDNASPHDGNSSGGDVLGTGPRLSTGQQQRQLQQRLRQ